MQAAVDAHTVAKIWQYLRDAYFIDSRSEMISMMLAVENARARVLSFWNLRIQLTPSGRFSGRATLNSIPLARLLTREGWVRTAMHAALLILVFSHTVVVSSPRPTETRTFGRPTHSVKTGRPRVSTWFRLLCQISFGCLCGSVLVNIWLNTAALEVLAEFDTSAMRMPAQEYIPVGMYRDLTSPARLLMPTKVPVQTSGSDEPTCRLVSDGSSGMLEVDASQGTDVPLWARDTDNTHLNNLTRMLVRCCKSYASGTLHTW